MSKLSGVSTAQGPSDKAALINAPAAGKTLQNQMLQFLKMIVRPGEVTELFIKDVQRPGFQLRVCYTGYYDSDHLGQLVSDATEYSGKARAIYFRINPVNTEILARSVNRVQPTRDVGAGNNDNIVSRRLMLIDVDPRRDGGISATAAERKFARKKVLAVREYLHKHGWPAPITCDSGNGYCLMYRVDLPRDDEELVHRVLLALSREFDDEHVHIDTVVHDPARVARLPGTLNCKGDDTAERPHRIARVLKRPERLRVVRRSLLEELAVSDPSPSAAKPVSFKASNNKTLNKARNYVAKMPPAISGQRGHDQTFKVGCKLLIDFRLDHQDALTVFKEYNERCLPPWSEEELKRKLQQADRSAEERKSSRGSLVLRAAGGVDEYLNWEPLRGAAFVGWVPDFSSCELDSVLLPLADFERRPWSWWFDLFAASTLLISHPLIPDAFLRQLYWGGKWPSNWLRQLKKWRNQSLLETTRKGAACKKEFCFLSGTGVSHRHFAVQVTHFGSFESFVSNSQPVGSSRDDDVEDEDAHLQTSPSYLDQVPRNLRRFLLYDKDSKGLLKQERKNGKVAPIYWPALLLGHSKKVGWTSAQIRLLLGILREMTRTRVGSGSKFEIIYGDKVLPAGRGSQLVKCPLLDSSGAYVTFGGNGLRHGRGYKLVGETWNGWLHRAGYRRQVGTTAREMAQRFLRDLCRLAQDLDLIVVGYIPRHRYTKWRGLDELQSCLKTRGGREWLNKCTVRIYAPSDWLVRWRYFFSKQLGFCWIPRSADDQGPSTAEPAAGTDRIDSASKLRQFLKTQGLTQNDLAWELSRLSGRPVSRQRVSRHVNDKSHSASFFHAVDELRRAVDTTSG